MPTSALSDIATPADIATPDDIDRLMAAFYERVLADPIIGFLFTDIARIDLAEHLPVISAFWQQQLLGGTGYRGQTFARHRDLHARSALTADHFHRWLFLFTTTVDALFSGPRAQAAKTRAARIAASMQEALARKTADADISAIGGVHFFQPDSSFQPDATATTNNPHSTRRERP